MLASRWPSFRFPPGVHPVRHHPRGPLPRGPRFGAQAPDRIRPVTDAELLDPSPDEWLMWRRTLNRLGLQPARSDRP